MMRFRRFLIARNEENNNLSSISIFGFQCVAKTLNGDLNICSSYLVLQPIWLNLPRDDCPFFGIFQSAIFLSWGESLGQIKRGPGNHPKDVFGKTPPNSPGFKQIFFEFTRFT
jgi:hypothetical protein